MNKNNILYLKKEKELFHVSHKTLILAYTIFLFIFSKSIQYICLCKYIILYTMSKISFTNYYYVLLFIIIILVVFITLNTFFIFLMNLPYCIYTINSNFENKLFF